MNFGSKTDQGTLITREYFTYFMLFINNFNLFIRQQLHSETDKLRSLLKDQFTLNLAVDLTRNLVLDKTFAEFLTLDAYKYLN